MGQSGRYRHAIRYLLARWPQLLLAYCGLIGLLLLIGVSVLRGWWGLVPISLALLLVLGYFLTTAVFAAHKLYDEGGIQPHHLLFDMVDIQAQDSFVVIDLGARWQPMSLARRLTKGKISVIDVYNPQIIENRPLTNMRLRAPHPPQDPRLEWLASDISLLPLPNEVVQIVLLPEVLTPFEQHGDRLILLRELFRILQPGGSVLLAERTKSQTNWLLYGLGATALKTADYWQALLQEAGFVIQKERDVQGYIYCLQAHKPTPYQARQLRLQLEFATA